jgi:DNA polymerase III subunit epsilon
MAARPRPGSARPVTAMRIFSSPAWDAVTYWALDLETGGLDPKAHPILAVGMVPLRAGTIRMREAFQTLVRPDAPVDPRSVPAHGLMGGEVGYAPLLADALGEVDRRIREGALLVHGKGLDVAFLRRAYRRAGLRWPSPPVVDTVALLVRAGRRARILHPELGDEPSVVNLARARRLHGLPDYPVHDALTDAIAAAELFLVLRHRLGARTLRDLRG